MERSSEINELAAALAKAQGEISTAAKDGLNPAFRNAADPTKAKGSRYMSLSSAWEACREALSKHNLCVSQMPVDSPEPGRVALETAIMHASGQFIVSKMSTRLQKDDAQGVGSAITYLRRYALAAVVGIVADDDDDGNAASQTPDDKQQRGGNSRPTTNRSAPQPKPQANEKAWSDRFAETVEEFGLDGADHVKAIREHYEAGAAKKNKKFDFNAPSAAAAEAILRDIRDGKFDHLKDSQAPEGKAA